MRARTGGSSGPADSSWGDALARAFKEWLLQEVIDAAVTLELGERRSDFRRWALRRWRCPRCGPRLGSELRRNGHHQRRPLVLEGSVELRIPQVLCVDCGKSVPFTHPLLPLRKRLWPDIDQHLAVLYLEGCRYRAVKRLVEGSCRIGVGLIARALLPGDGPPPPCTRGAGAFSRHLAVDEFPHRVQGE